jgi:hypothetical protein
LRWDARVPASNNLPNDPLTVPGNCILLRLDALGAVGAKSRMDQAWAWEIKEILLERAAGSQQLWAESAAAESHPPCPVARAQRAALFTACSGAGSYLSSRPLGSGGGGNSAAHPVPDTPLGTVFVVGAAGVRRLFVPRRLLGRASFRIGSRT